MRSFFLIIAGLLLAIPSLANSEPDPRNRIAFQVEATREVANDWAVARLSVVAEGKDPSAIANVVNRKMAKTLETTKRISEVEPKSGAYTTQPIYNDGRIVRWRARQELRLESGNVDALSKLVGDLQGESVLLSGIDFSVKRETRTALENELIDDALARFRARATRVTKRMGADDWTLVSLSINQSGGAPRMMHMRAESSMMSSSMKSAPPAFEAGTSEIQVHVSGSIELE